MDLALVPGECGQVGPRDRLPLRDRRTPAGRSRRGHAVPDAHHALVHNMGGLAVANHVTVLAGS